MLFPFQKEQLFWRKKWYIPPMDNTVLILKIPCLQAQIPWRQRRPPPKSVSPSINTDIPDKDLMWCNSSDSNTTTRGDNTNHLPKSPVATPTKPAQQNISFGNTFFPKTFHKSTLHDYKSKTKKKTPPAYSNSDTQDPKNINYIHISDIISGKSLFPGLNTTNKPCMAVSYCQWRKT